MPDLRSTINEDLFITTTLNQKWTVFVIVGIAYVPTMVILLMIANGFSLKKLSVPHHIQPWGILAILSLVAATDDETHLETHWWNCGAVCSGTVTDVYMYTANKRSKGDYDVSFTLSFATY